jgi:hypothetical protein
MKYREKDHSNAERQRRYRERQKEQKQGPRVSRRRSNPNAILGAGIKPDGYYSGEHK